MTIKYKSLSAILIAVLALSMMFAGCGNKETVESTPTPTPSDTASPEPAEPVVTPVAGWKQIDLSDESKPWVKQILSGQLKDIPIYKDEHELFPRIYYEPEGWREERYLNELQLVGYITGTDPVYKAIEDVCAEYVKVAYTFDYRTFKGDEAWYLLGERAAKYSKEHKNNEIDKKKFSKSKIVCESKGIDCFTEFLINATGEEAWVAFDHIIKETGTPEYMETCDLNPDGTETMSELLNLRYENGSWKINNVQYEEIEQVELQPLAE